MDKVDLKRIPVESRASWWFFARKEETIYLSKFSHNGKEWRSELCRVGFQTTVSNGASVVLELDSVLNEDIVRSNYKIVPVQKGMLVVDVRDKYLLAKRVMDIQICKKIGMDVLGVELDDDTTVYIENLEIVSEEWMCKK